jgi:methanogenic corrinoid protein MtbC1
VPRPALPEQYNAKQKGKSAMSAVLDEVIYQRYLVALLDGDRPRCAGIVRDLVAGGTSLKDLYVHLFQRALYAVGERWEHQRISVAVEHLATAITERMLILVQPHVFSGRARDRIIVIACVAVRSQP